MIVIQRFSQQQQLKRNVVCSSFLSCDNLINNNNNKKVISHLNAKKITTQDNVIKPFSFSSSSSSLSLLSYLLTSLLLILITSASQLSEAEPQHRPPTEYQLVGQVNQEAHLPCLIGRQLYCGEPYFIAWYKFNGSSKSWVRIEHSGSSSSSSKSAANGDDELANDNNGNDDNLQLAPTKSAAEAEVTNQHQLSGHRPINERVQFTWTRSQQQQQQQHQRGSSWRPACDQPLNGRHGVSAAAAAAAASAKLEANFDCAQLTIGRLELMDEGQYKCEITFSESLDFDKCPATTLSQLSVIGKCDNRMKVFFVCYSVLLPETIYCLFALQNVLISMVTSLYKFITG